MSCPAKRLEASRIKFPIPMRGNEDRSGGIAERGIEFPIPMRGNEWVWAPGGATVAYEGFQSP